MYLYIDEAGNFGWPYQPGRSDPFMVIAVLAIYDKASKAAIAQAVSRAIIDLKKHHQHYRRVPTDKVPELKGHVLRNHPDVRLRFFKRIVRKADFELYTVRLDKRVLNQRLHPDYMKRYSILAMNVLATVRVPKGQHWVTMVRGQSE